MLFADKKRQIQYRIIENKNRNNKSVKRIGFAFGRFVLFSGSLFSHLTIFHIAIALTLNTNTTAAANCRRCRRGHSDVLVYNLVSHTKYKSFIHSEDFLSQHTLIKMKLI